MFKIFPIKKDKNYLSCKNKEMELARLHFIEVRVRNGCEAYAGFQANPPASLEIVH